VPVAGASIFAARAGESSDSIASTQASAWLYLYPQVVVARSNVSGYGVNSLNSQFFVSGISKN